MTVPPTVRVKKVEGFHSCAKVCTSWSLKRSTTRKHYSFTDEQASSSAEMKGCDVVAPATSHHYTCSCEI